MIATVPRVFERLKLETHSEHAALERKLAILERPLTPDRYIQILSAFYGFYRSWEQALWPWVERLFGESAAVRRKSHMLASDLQWFGVDPDSVPLHEGFRAYPSAASAIGSLYVMEGATLGGQIIVRKVHTDLALQDENGCRFFTGYGKNTATLWRQFREAVAEWPVADSAVTEWEDQTIKSAASTFRSFHGWLGEMGL